MYRLLIFVLIFSFPALADYDLYYSRYAAGFPGTSSDDFCIEGREPKPLYYFVSNASCANGFRTGRRKAYEYRNCAYREANMDIKCDIYDTYDNSFQGFANYSLFTKRIKSDDDDNYCDTPAAYDAEQEAKKSCSSRAGDNQTIARNEAKCNRKTEVIETFCEINDKSSSGGDTGGGDTGGGDTGGGSGSGGSGSGGSGSGGSGSGGSGSGGSGSGGSGSGGSGSGGSGSGGSGSGGSGSGGSGSGDISVDVDMSGVISAINRTNSNIDGHLKVLQRDSAKELQNWSDTQDLVSKYYETAKKSSSSLDHMAKFTEQELSILRSIQGEYGTHFDRIYNKSNSILNATNDFKTANINKLDAINESLNQLNNDLDIESINKALADNSKLEQEQIDELKQLMAEKSDEQTEKITASVDAVADSITNDIKVEIDTKAIEDKLDNVNSELDKQTGLMEEFGKGGKRNLVGCRTNDTCSSLIDSRYTDGLDGIIEKHFTSVKNGAFLDVVNQFNVHFPSQAPEWNLCLDIIIDFGCYDIRLPAFVWTFIRICIMFTAFMTCRKLVFGG
ncbi:hypothetical protein C942_00845 [Photobacterium marinum]|uniref:Uncharacterized protein n=1 Tax=Photobacterium marinum TaxID=1056511 RepID=L8JE40_9GAMM|nr:hypothetical protein [Photobacterium marinum]ELR65759.1 hypothetical protein C942_00845 [Photobacterium marinum]